MRLGELKWQVLVCMGLLLSAALGGLDATANEKKRKFGESLAYESSPSVLHRRGMSPDRSICCKQESCLKLAQVGGFCVKHGGGRRCGQEGCPKLAQARGFCVQHGGGRRCGEEGCSKLAQVGGLCCHHGGGRRCGQENCDKFALQGGLCRIHGGGKRCVREGCGKLAPQRGLCKAHGGGRRCGEEGCPNSALSGGRCARHGGGPRCTVEGCATLSRSRGLCARHGGGLRCTAEGCTKLSRTGGLCRAHQTLQQMSEVDTLVKASPALAFALGVTETIPGGMVPGMQTGELDGELFLGEDSALPGQEVSDAAPEMESLWGLERFLDGEEGGVQDTLPMLFDLYEVSADEG